MNIPNRVERPLIQPEAVYNNGISLVTLEYQSVNECTRSATFADWQGDAGFPCPRERAATVLVFRVLGITFVGNFWNTFGETRVRHWRNG